MTPERRQHIKSLLDSALEREPERKIFFAEACARDPKLAGMARIASADHKARAAERPEEGSQG
ncbi:MAG: hypothetical protein ABR568_16790 [Pyrinomonadaceae bacterium]